MASSSAWLAEARIDLLWIERTESHPDLLRRLCYAAQQAAEKALKAVISHHGVQPLKTHHMGQLVECAATHVDVPDDIRRAYVLTEYVATTRYPDDYYELSQDETDEAVAIAVSVVAWATVIVNASR